MRRVEVAKALRGNHAILRGLALATVHLRTLNSRGQTAGSGQSGDGQAADGQTGSSRQAKRVRKWICVVLSWNRSDHTA